MQVFSFTLKIILIYSLFLAFSSCETDESDDQTAKDNALVVGYWLVKKGETYAINNDGEKIKTATLNPDVFAHEFLADGSYIGHDLVSNHQEKGTWKLEVQFKDLNDIEEGILSISTPSTMSSGNPFADPDGSLKYKISTILSKVTNKKSVMYLETKKYESYPYKENWAYFTLEKQ